MHHAHLPAGLKARPLKSSKKAKKNDDIDLGGAESLIVTHLTKQSLGTLDFFSQFDTLVFFILLPIFSLLVAELTYYLGRPLDGLPIVTGLVCVLGSLWMLMKVDLLSAYTSGADKVYAVCFAVLAFVLALVALTMVPKWLLGFDVDAGAAAVGPLLMELVRRSSPKVQDIPAVELPAVALQLLMALLAAVISMTFFAPTLRFVRSYWLQHNVPDWASEQIPSSAGGRLLLNLHLLLLLAATLLWVRPLSEALALAPRALAFLQAGALLAAGAVQIGLVRLVVQRFADSSLLAWHQLKHGLMGHKKTQKVTVGELIRVKSKIVYALLGKAAVQSLAPGALFLGLGLLQLYGALHPSLSSAANANVLLHSTSGFLAWWAGLSWFATCAIELWLFRTGTLQN
ncbi:hypothetical protein N2152v2_008312 [Parachlorella kessleri]